MQTSEIENLLCQALEEKLIVEVTYKSGKMLRGWVQHYEPAEPYGVFRMMVNRDYQQDVDLINVAAVMLTDEAA